MCTTLALSGALAPIARADNVVSVAPTTLHPTVGLPTTLTFSGARDVPALLYATYYEAITFQQPESACSPPTPGTEFVHGIAVEGAFSVMVTETFPRTHFNLTYLCVWLASPGTVPPGSDTLAPPVLSAVSFSVPPVVSRRTSVHSRFAPAAGRLRVSVSSYITATGSIPRGYCILEARSGGNWVYATAYQRVGRDGLCRISTTVAHAGRRRFRVVFRADHGFEGSIGAASWVNVRNDRADR